MDAVGAQDELKKFCDVVGVESGSICPGSLMARPPQPPHWGLLLVSSDAVRVICHLSPNVLLFRVCVCSGPWRRRMRSCATRRISPTTGRTRSGARRTSAQRRAAARGGLVSRAVARRLCLQTMDLPCWRPNGGGCAAAAARAATRFTGEGGDREAHFVRPFPLHGGKAGARAGVGATCAAGGVGGVSKATAGRLGSYKKVRPRERECEA